MAPSIYQTLIRSCSPFLISAQSSRNGVRLISFRYYSTQAESISQFTVDPSSSNSSSELEALAVRKIEDAIHHIIVKRSTPDWLPFVPEASYWVPPKRRNYGIAQIVHKLAVANALSDDEVMSLTTAFGWPSSDFYIHVLHVLKEMYTVCFCLPDVANDDTSNASSHHTVGETSSNPGLSVDDEA